ncbi:MAG: hypothetical protein PHO20_02760 [Candidatus Peribacteraceae bacterium]|jgi:hypothetical protein|nr:hypothetical protein [Candidatus Peribacteraceae bacterium]MDD5739662.1 hypothetical protein [Candidatus Peribacteraceae bacterium]
MHPHAEQDIAELAWDEPTEPTDRDPWAEPENDTPDGTPLPPEVSAVTREHIRSIWPEGDESQKNILDYDEPEMPSDFDHWAD